MAMKMSTLGSRIKTIRSHFGLKQEDFGLKIGISGNRVSEIEHDKGSTSATVLESLCQNFPIQPEWLISGKGSMLDGAKNDHRQNSMEERITLVENQLKHLSIVKLHETDTAESMQVPLYSNAVPAGLPAEATEEIDGYVDFPISWTHGRKNVYALKVNGDSMMDIGIMSGDTLMVEARDTARDGQVVIASVNAEVTVKTLCISSTGAVSLVPENRKYKPIAITPETDFRILGVVLAAVRQYR